MHPLEPCVLGYFPFIQSALPEQGSGQGGSQGQAAVGKPITLGERLLSNSQRLLPSFSSLFLFFAIANYAYDWISGHVRPKFSLVRGRNLALVILLEHAAVAEPYTEQRHRRYTWKPGLQNHAAPQGC
jgi:hypothetical protein